METPASAATFVIGVGVEKCGTTSISRFLRESGMIGPGIKELHAFHHFHFLSRERYLKKLGYSGGGGIYGEWTPGYSQNPSTIWNLSCILPEAKILFSLRNPIERAFSSYRHAVRAGHIPTTETFDEVVDDVLAGTARPWVRNLLHMGRYDRQLQRVYAHYDPATVMVIDFERLKQESTRVVLEDELLAFTGLHRVPGVAVRQVNAASKRPDAPQSASTEISSEAKAKLIQHYAETRAALSAMVPFELNWW